MPDEARWSKPQMFTRENPAVDATRDPFGADVRNYDIAPDGARFLMIKESETPAEIFVVVLNWFSELEEHVPN